MKSSMSLGSLICSSDRMHVINIRRDFEKNGHIINNSYLPITKNELMRSGRFIYLLSLTIAKSTRSIVSKT